MNIYDRLKELNISIPPLPKPVATYEPAVMVDDWVYASGQTGKQDGVLKYVGKVDAEVTVEQAYESARLAALGCLAEVLFVIDDLNRIERIVKVTGYVASSECFGLQPKVVEGASSVLVDIFGDRGRHARAAVGVAELPFDAPVEIELIAKIKR